MEQTFSRPQPEIQIGVLKSPLRFADTDEDDHSVRLKDSDWRIFWFCLFFVCLFEMGSRMGC